MQALREEGWLTEEVYFNTNQLKIYIFPSVRFQITISEMKNIFILIRIRALSHMKFKFFLGFNNTVWKYSTLLILKFLSFDENGFILQRIYQLKKN